MTDGKTVLREIGRFARFLISELRPRGRLLTVFNVISIPVMAAGAIILTVRFVNGLGSVTNLSQSFPWGVWKGFNVITGVAFAGGAYVLTFAVYVMRMEKYRPIVRATILNGLLAYVFYAGALVFELGRPWKIMNPIIGNEFGYSSVLFLVSWHFLLYMVAELIEFSPAVAEWLGWRRARRILHGMTLTAVILGITLSSLHQSGLGALYLMAKPKIHPLWYTEFIPILFLVSSIFAGISMVILEGSISRRVFADQLDATRRAELEPILVGLAKGAAVAMFTYYFFKALVFLHERHWDLLATGWGAWYVLEVVGLTLVPCVLFAYGARHRRLGVIRVAAVLAVLGILLNRLNISLIAFNWDAAVRYVPTWMEVVVSLAVVFAEIWVFRWIVTRMAVIREPHELPRTFRRAGRPAAAKA